MSMIDESLPELSGLSECIRCRRICLLELPAVRLAAAERHAGQIWVQVGMWAYPGELRDSVLLCAVDCTAAAIGLCRLPLPCPSQKWGHGEDQQRILRGTDAATQHRQQSMWSVGTKPAAEIETRGSDWCVYNTWGAVRAAAAGTVV